jgi:hypothetical protein
MNWLDGLRHAKGWGSLRSTATSQGKHKVVSPFFLACFLIELNLLLL